jgi:uncharacterized RDD family membrane protein YckC
MGAVNPSSTGRDLLGDLDEIVVLNYASQGQRFGNFIIDWIVTFALLLGLGYIAGMLYGYGLIGESGLDWFRGPLSFITTSVTGIAYYTFMEAFCKGRTIGKLVTGTYAVRNDGQPLTLKQAFLRELCRMVPFETLSGLGPAPWHDSWTNTTVVKK